MLKMKIPKIPKVPKIPKIPTKILTAMGSYSSVLQQMGEEITPDELMNMTGIQADALINYDTFVDIMQKSFY